MSYGSLLVKFILTESRWKMATAATAVFLIGLVSTISIASIVRAIIAIYVIFYLPGNMSFRLLNPHRRADINYMLYSFGLSTVITIASGFLLSFAGSMTSAGWTILLGLISIIAYAFHRWRRARSALEQRHEYTFFPVSGLEASMLICATVITASALMIDRHEAVAHSEFKYTEFWMVSQDPGKPNLLTLGVKNNEGEPAFYEIEYMADGQIAGRLPAFRLQPGDVWTSVLETGLQAGRIQRVEAWLFKNKDHSIIYRRVWADIGSRSRENS
jgi:uncharacterized membrane protein YidH (DUF202 family)